MDNGGEWWTPAQELMKWRTGESMPNWDHEDLKSGHINKIYTKPNVKFKLEESDFLPEEVKPTAEETEWIQRFDEEVNTGTFMDTQVDMKVPFYPRPLCYISGPMMSEGHAYANIGEAIELGEIAYERGWAPIIPHLDCLVSMVTGNTDRKRYMDTDLSILSKCACVCVLPYKMETDADGNITGTAEEINFAQDNNIPVYTEETLPWVN